MTFKNDEERRGYFRNELRKKLPELKKIEGFPIGDDEDIIALSDPPYYTACPNPWINDFIEEWEREKKEKYGRDENEEYHREPFAADVSEGKNDPIYNAHSYHTKVPHKAIMRYILHYTNPGDIVFDGFAGTGMTGVAAQLCGDRKAVESLGYQVQEDGTILDEEGRSFSKLGSRKAILNDLSPAASFIAYNYNTPVDIEAFEKEAKQILDEVEQECGWMYETHHVLDGIPQVDQNGDPIKGRINYTVWSDVFVCPHCTGEIIFWEAAVDQEAGKVRDTFNCPSCGSEHTKRSVERAWVTRFDSAINETIRQVKQVPVLINYSVGNKRFEKQPDAEDLALIEKIEEMEIPYWFPTNRIPEGDKTGEPIRIGITHVHHFYTKRSLWILSAIKHRVKSSQMQLLFNSQLINISKLNRYRPGVSFPYNPLSGTLYIGSQVSEANVLIAYKNKLKRLLTAFKRVDMNTITSVMSSNQRSSTRCDYIFTDPPFGNNLMYSELNFLWESWLKVFTNNQTEAIVNKTQEKGLLEYQRLMEACFREYYRVLKPGRWMTVEFSNSQAAVWNVIQEAIQRAGFIIANVAALDKKQGSFNAVTSTTAVKQDLVISAYKPKEENIEKMKREQNTEESAWTFVRQHLEQLPVFIGHKGEAQIIAERTPRILFDRMVAYHVQNGLPVPISSAEFQAGVAQRFPMRDGMAFLESQVAEYDKKRTLVKEFAQMSLFVTDETSAIEWLRQQLLKKPQTRQDIHPNFMKEIQHIAKHEKLPELDDLLHQNFLKYEGDGPVPDQIASYLRRNYKDLRGLENDDPQLKEKAMNRWYVPDPNKQADLEKLREKALLREFEGYLEELEKSKKKLKQFRTEAIRAGFKKAWSDKDYEKIVKVGERLPESVIQEDDKLLMYYDNAQIRLGL
ncbi:DNA methylase [Anoxybacillus flavithermus]|nr:DNA methylase [Anoxybacillus flavithermus]MBE2929217.1 DNA methylase [Anoxybacillus flavithermus]MBE2937650.1 DNA methylase [Anoxybacillus flavithermus]MBE2945293.1 DNA methylase [Anoxybacillus flavithermus]MBE2948225.1 DNA methylase [Anoxybacillus flavithermus]